MTNLTTAAYLIPCVDCEQPILSHLEIYTADGITPLCKACSVQRIHPSMQPASVRSEQTEDGDDDDGTPPGHLTADEQEVLDLLAAVADKYVTLPRQHVNEWQEMVQAIHRAQDLVLIRPTQRAMNLTEPEAT